MFLGNSTDSLLLLKFEDGSAPPISLSSPELGAESEGFEEHIRNSYSSSELLYERNLNRFNTYSNNNNENASSEAQKIAIYAMDRKNSLRRSPITRRSNDDSEGKSVFSDSDSVHSVVEMQKATNASSFMSLESSIEEEITNDTKESIDNAVPSTSFVSSKSESPKESEDEYVSNSSDEEIMNFGSGKRALEQNTSSAFFSTVYFDDDYLSDHRLSDREQSTSPAREVEKIDRISQDSLNTETVSSSSDYSQLDKDVDNEERFAKNNFIIQNVENKVNSVGEINQVEPLDMYRPRDGIPKYVMLPNPFYKETAAVDNSNRVKFELSSNSDEIIPPEIPKRVNNESNIALPVITVTETSEHSPKSLLKKIIVPSFAGLGESYYDKYNNVNSSTFNTLKRSPEREIVKNKGEETNASAGVREDAAELVVVKHYGDILERYSCAGKKTSSKTYLDFEQLKMAAVEDEPVILDGPAEGEEYESDFEEAEGISYPALEEELLKLDARDSMIAPNDQLAIVEPPAAKNTIPYLEIFGNLSLAMLGYWLYLFKDERLSVPVFGFLFFRFFKTQVWDRI